MTARTRTEPDLPLNQPEEQLLGELETCIVRVRRCKKQHDGPAIVIGREPDDPQAIRVENRVLGLAGYLPEELVSWLARLIDQGAVRVEGHVPTGRRATALAAVTHPLVLTVFVRPAAMHWLRESLVETTHDALHEVVRRAYEDAQRLVDPACVQGLADGLRRLEQADLLPQTRLLLALMPGLVRETQAGVALRTIATLRSLVAQLTISPPLHCHGLTFFPLVWPTSEEPGYVLLADALDRGEAVVEEISEDGSVPNVRVINRCDKPLLIPEGEILVGAKQNRVVNATVLVAARSTFTLPVSCVEQGRWGYQSREFRSAFCAPPSLRACNMRAVRGNRDDRGAAEGDQDRVWSCVADGLADVGVDSPTASLTDGFSSMEERLRQCRQELRLPASAAGILVACGERVVGVDLFDSPTTFTRLWDRVSNAYFFDVFRTGEAAPPASPAPLDVAPAFLGQVVGRAQLRLPALGLGDELAIAGEGLVGAALLHAGRLVHLAAFTEIGP
jgi:hypothetical protein